MEAWQNFFLAQVGAAAALTGLIFVSVSISLAEIMAAPQLPVRAFQALVFLLQILIVSMLVLVPQPITGLGAEVLAIGVAVWTMAVVLDRRAWQSAQPAYRARVVGYIVLSQIAGVCYVLAGVTLLARGTPGLYWLVPAMILSYLTAMLDAWVLMIEIHR